MDSVGSTFALAAVLRADWVTVTRYTHTHMRATLILILFRDLPDVIYCQFHEFAVAPLGHVLFL